MTEEFKAVVFEKDELGYQDRPMLKASSGTSGPGGFHCREENQQFLGEYSETSRKL